MFGTVILDVYKKEETEQIAFALDELCCPNDNYGWSSAGIYSFWDYYTKEIYYIGLAVDLHERFKQHNGLVLIDDNSCKRKQIEQYFETNDKLGYSIFVQSPLSQPVTHKNKKELERFAQDQLSPIEDYVGNIGKEHIRRVEGILIESYKKVNGDFPLWNSVGGSLDGQRVSKLGNYEIIKSFTNIGPSPLVSRCTLRELAENPTYERYENFLHAARMMMLTLGISFLDAIDRIRQFSIIDTYGEMIEKKYFEKKLIL